MVAERDQFERSELAAEALAAELDEARVGVVVQGLTGIDPIRIADSVAETLGRELYVAIVGEYPVSDDGSHNITVATDVESAVTWRSMPELRGKIVVFTPGEVAKLHSLGDLDDLS